MGYLSNADDVVMVDLEWFEGPRGPWWQARTLHKPTRSWHLAKSRNSFTEDGIRPSREEQEALLRGWGYDLEASAATLTVSTLTR